MAQGGAPESDRFDRVQDQAPAEALQQIDCDAGYHGERDPLPIHGGEVVVQFAQLGVAQSPGQAA